MKTYNSYQEAQVAHPHSLIIENSGVFDAMENVASSQIHKWNQCNPADYCISVGRFFELGHKFTTGDKFTLVDGTIITVDESLSSTSNVKGGNDFKCYVLKAKALSKASNEESEWDGNGLPPAGTECEFKKHFESDDCFSECYIIGTRNGAQTGDLWLVFSDKYDKLHQHHCDNGVFVFRKPEGIGQKDEYERLLSAYALYSEWLGKGNRDVLIDFEEWKTEPDFYKKWLRVAGKAGYRVEGDKDGSVPVQANKLPENGGKVISVNDDSGSSIQLCIADVFNAHKLFNHYCKVNDIEGQMHIEVFTGNAHLCANWVSILEKAKELLKEGK